MVTDDIVQRARQALDDNNRGSALRFISAAPQLLADLVGEVEKLRSKLGAAWLERDKYASSERVLASTIDRVRMLHSKRPVAPGCTNCSEPWPCSTIRAIEAQGGPR